MTPSKYYLLCHFIVDNLIVYIQHYINIHIQTDIPLGLTVEGGYLPFYGSVYFNFLISPFFLFYGSQFGSFGNSGRSHSSFRSSPRSIVSINSQMYKKQVTDKGITWLLFSYAPSMNGMEHYESIVDEVASSLKGLIQVGSVNCEVESSLCKELGIRARNRPRVYVYSYKTSEAGSLLEYTGDVTVKDLKSFVQDHLPRFSKRVTLGQFEAESVTVEPLPKVMLLSTKKDTPVIWRALSGLYRKRFVFYDTQVQDVSDPRLKKLGADELPAVVGWLSNGEKRILKTGIHVKDMKSTISDLGSVLIELEKSTIRNLLKLWIKLFSSRHSLLLSLQLHRLLQFGNILVQGKDRYICKKKWSSCKKLPIEIYCRIAKG